MDLRSIRHYIHQNPELSGQEERTSQFISEKLKSLGVHKIHQQFSEHSILAEIDFQNEGKTILFRAELDALPIEELNTFDYASIHPNVSHKCGHDGHMTILIGLAERLFQSTSINRGKILLLFQSSEETGKGAKGVVESKILESFSIDYTFALHNIPGFPLGSIICKSGSFTASVESLDISLFGKTSHAGMPDAGINPALAIHKIIGYFNSIHVSDINRDDYFLATPIQIHMGTSAYGTSAGEAIMSYTLRSWNYEYFVNKKKEIIQKIDEIVAETKGLTHSLEWKESFDANFNSEEAYQLVKKSAEDNNFVFIEKEHPFSWGEDFGTFSQMYKGAMFCIGSGDTPELHNPDFDFPDELIDVGVQMFYSIATQILNGN